MHFLIIILISIISILPIFIAIYYLIVESKNDYWEKPVKQEGEGEDVNSEKPNTKEEDGEEEDGFGEKPVFRNILSLPFGNQVFLPRNLFIQIFQNLSVKEFGRSLRVCNLWNSFFEFDGMANEVKKKMKKKKFLLLFHIQIN